MTLQHAHTDIHQLMRELSGPLAVMSGCASLHIRYLELYRLDSSARKPINRQIREGFVGIPPISGPLTADIASMLKVSTSLIHGP